jgi:dephospho-CoA kinase
MLVIGLTGGIGMGKSTAAKILQEFGLPVYHADKAVHLLLKKGGAAVKPVAKLFPDTLKKGAIDRQALGEIVFGDDAKLKKLEKILHPLVQKMENEFLSKAKKRKALAAVLEIPLLFETNGGKRCDFTICVTAPKDVQKERVLQREGMTPAKFAAILKRQMSDKDKRAKADYVVHTGDGYAKTVEQLRRILLRASI